MMTAVVLTGRGGAAPAALQRSSGAVGAVVGGALAVGAGAQVGVGLGEGGSRGLGHGHGAAG